MKNSSNTKRRSVIEAGISEFSRRGYEGTSMDHIAAVSGVSKRTVYNHFASKDVLFREIIGEFAAEMAGLKQIGYRPDLPLFDQLNQFAEAELAILQHPVWKGFTRALLASFLKDPQWAQQIRDAQPEHADPLVDWITAAKNDGRIQTEDPRRAAQVFAAMMGGAFSWPAVYQGELDPATIEPLKDELIRTFLHRFGTAASPVLQ